MKNTKETKKIFVDDLEFVYTGAPKTHIFYEYEGERAVHPHQLAMDGIVLWREQAQNNLEHKNEVLRLWNHAESLLTKREETPTHSYVEWLRHAITMGALDPKKSWKQKKPYAYRGMLISAIYFQEAAKLCDEGNADRVWHIITMAYYHLGMNTTPSTTQLSAKAARKKHQDAVETRRELALGALEAIKEQQKKKQTIRNIGSAIDEVIKLIHSNKGALSELERVDALSANRDKNNDALDRFRNLLHEWATPNSPHPDITEAFSVYGQKEYSPKTESAGPDVPGSSIPSHYTHYMRLVHFSERGYEWTEELYREKETSEPEPPE